MFNYSSRDIIDQTEMIVSVMSVSICLVFWNMIYFVCSTTQTGSMALSPFACRSFQGLNSGLFVVRASCTSARGSESALVELQVFLSVSVFLGSCSGIKMGRDP